MSKAKDSPAQKGRRGAGTPEESNDIPKGKKPKDQKIPKMESLDTTPKVKSRSSHGGASLVPLDASLDTMAVKQEKDLPEDLESFKEMIHKKIVTGKLSFKQIKQIVKRFVAKSEDDASFLTKAMKDCSLVKKEPPPKKPVEDLYYDKRQFLYGQDIDKKYSCMHCDNVPKKFYLCQCITPREGAGRGGKKLDNNDGLTCSECMGEPCLECECTPHRYDEYLPNGINVLLLRVNCPKNCQLKDHLDKTCCKPISYECYYSVIGCEVMSSKEERDQHLDMNNAKHLPMVQVAVSEMKKLVDSLNDKLNTVIDP